MVKIKNDDGNSGRLRSFQIEKLWRKRRS